MRKTIQRESRETREASNRNLQLLREALKIDIV
jgi:hypothetical protein